MGAIVRIPDFTAGHSGLAFANSFPSQPDVSVRVPIYGSVNIGDASNGVCGGMVFTVLDLRTFGRPAFPDTEPPAADSPLFHYIVRRLIDSWDLPNGVLKYLSWMNTSDGDQSLLSITRRGVWRRTLVDEWPKVRAALDGGRLCPLGLVTVESRNPGDLGATTRCWPTGTTSTTIRCSRSGCTTRTRRRAGPTTCGWVAGRGPRIARARSSTT